MRVTCCQSEVATRHNRQVERRRRLREVAIVIELDIRLLNWVFMRTPNVRAVGKRGSHCKALAIVLVWVPHRDGRVIKRSTRSLFCRAL
jgi:hypothetical protein